MLLQNLRSARLLIAGVSFALVGCTPSHANSSSIAMKTARCAASAGLVEVALNRGPTILAPNALKLDRYYTLNGDCADGARSFEMDQVLFADGTVMSVQNSGQLSIVSQRPSTVEPSALSPDQAPRLNDAALIYAAEVGVRGQDANRVTSYVGVWAHGGKSTIASFKITADGRQSTPQQLLVSELPILGVGYFPAIDSQSGQLGVVQKVSGETVRLLNYQWYHPSI